MWQTIDTAPRDGTAVFAFWGKDTTPDARSYAVTLYRNGKWRNPDIADDGEYWGEPTHWMPLPSPPRAAAPKLAGEDRRE